MKNFMFLLISTFLLFSCKKEVTSMSKNSVTQNNVYSNVIKDSIIVDNISFNGCTNEIIHLTGKIVYTYKYSIFDGKANYVIAEHGDGLTAQSSSTTYHTTFHLTNNASTILTDSGYIAVNSNFTVKWIYTSPLGSNLTLSIYERIKINPDGSLKMFIEKYSYKCQ